MTGACCSPCATRSGPCAGSVATRADRGIEISRRVIGADHTITGVIRRAGALRYPHGVERIDSADLGDPRSIASLQGCPVRRGHGGRRVGVVLRAWVEGAELLAAIRLDDREAREDVEAGDLREFSPGYDCRIDADNVQRDVRFWELAILPPGHARCGSTCSIRTDEDDLSPSERARASMHARQVAAAASHTARALGPAAMRILVGHGATRVLRADEPDPDVEIR